ncbi:MAG: hypothetical protein ACC653_07200 [Gammaproteobacteria bacterium]
MSLRNAAVSMIMMLFVAFGVMKGFMYYSAKEKIDELIHPMKSFLNVEYQGISTSLMGSIGIKGLRLTSFNGDEILSFGRVTLSSFEKADNEKIPSNLSILLDDVQFDARHLNEVTNNEIPNFVRELGYGELYKFSNNLEKLGYDKITADIIFEFSYKKELGGVKLRLRENIVELGELDIFLDVIGFVPGMHAMGADLKIKKISLMFDDDSYTNRILKRFADKDNKAVNEYRIEIAQQLKKFLAQNKIMLDDSDINALKKFINKPKKLIVKIHPAEPVSVENLKFYKREDIPKILNLNISTE